MDAALNGHDDEPSVNPNSEPTSPDARPSLERILRLARGASPHGVALLALTLGDAHVLAMTSGLSEPWPERQEVDFEGSLWQRVETSGSVLALPDLRGDAELAGSFEAKALGLGAYLGVPIRDIAGDVIGVLAAGDAEVRHWTAEDTARLEDLAALTGERLEMDAQLRDRAGLRAQLERSRARSAEIVEELELQRERFERLFENAPEGIVIVDSDDRIRRANAEFSRMFGYSPEEVMGRQLADLIVPEDQRAESKRTTRQSAGGETLSFECMRRRRDGSLIPVSVLGAGIRVGGNEVAVYAIYRDITERVRAQEALRRLATTDDLTGLYNRRGFFLLAEQQWRLARRHGRPLALLFIDLDDFKDINDAHGHVEGDRVLAEVAALIRSCFRDTDVLARIQPAAEDSPEGPDSALLARMGGDEFVLLAVEAAADTDRRLTERLQQKVDEFNRTEKRPYRLSLSIGAVSIPPDDARPLDVWLRKADERMYRGKLKSEE